MSLFLCRVMLLLVLEFLTSQVSWWMFFRKRIRRRRRLVVGAFTKGSRLPEQCSSPFEPTHNISHCIYPTLNRGMYPRILFRNKSQGCLLNVTRLLSIAACLNTALLICYNKYGITIFLSLGYRSPNVRKYH